MLAKVGAHGGRACNGGRMLRARPQRGPGVEEGGWMGRRVAGR